MKTFKVQRIEDAVKGFAKRFRLEKDERKELQSLLHRIEKEDAKTIERSKNLDLLAASIVWAYLRWIGLNGHGGITLESVAEFFGVKSGSVAQKASTFDRILDRMDEELLNEIREEYAFHSTNRKTKDYIDMDRFPVQERFWELMEREDHYSDEELIAHLKMLIDMDPDFFDPYITLYELYMEQGNESVATEILTDGYVRALLLLGVVDDEDFPGLPWGFTENRHIVRIIYDYATHLWERGGNEKALPIYERLLRSNPEDNIGARYAIAAILDGYANHDAFERTFSNSEGYGLDPVFLDTWFQRVVREHPERFGWWMEWSAAQDPLL